MENKKVIIALVVIVAVGALVYFTKAKEGERTPTSADNAPPGSIHNLPVPGAVAKVKSLVAGNLSIDEGLVTILTAFEKEWSDSCLGLGGPAESCLQVITPGFEVKVAASGKEYTYRTNMDGSVIREDK